MADTEEKVNGNQADTEVTKAEGAESTDVIQTKDTPQTDDKVEGDMVVDGDNKDGDAEKPGEITDLDNKIIRQMEYYFGDFNLARDKFLQEQFKVDEGWVPMETMLKFKRLQTLSEDPVIICNALRKSPRALIEVSEENDKVRRSPAKPLPENTSERVAEVKARSIYAKGFPLDSSFDQLEEFFRKFGEVENIQMRRQIKKKFKGSVFVIFEKAEDAEKFVKIDDVKYGETVLVKSMKDDYFKRKNEERQQQKLEKEKERKATREENEKQKTEKEAQELQERMTKGSILHLTGLSGETSIEDVKNFFNDYSRVQWVDLENEDKEAFVRFAEADQAAVVLAKVKESNDGKVEVGGSELEGTVLEGEAEVERWKKIFAAQAESWKRKKSGRSNQHQGKKRGFGYKKHGQNRGNKGSRDKAEGEPPAKVAKTE